MSPNHNPNAVEPFDGRRSGVLPEWVSIPLHLHARKQGLEGFEQPVLVPVDEVER